jgi:hypothetical protein
MKQKTIVEGAAEAGPYFVATTVGAWTGESGSFSRRQFRNFDAFSHAESG